MALFGKKQDDGNVPTPPTPAPSSPGATKENTPATPETFDFESISRDLDVQNGASSFDSLLAAPVQNSPATPSSPVTGISEEDPLGLATPPISAPGSTTMPAPPATAGAPVATVPPPPRKSLPLVPLLGVLGVVAVAGAGFMLMRSSDTSETESNVPTAPPHPSSNSAATNIATVNSAVAPPVSGEGQPPGTGPRMSAPPLPGDEAPPPPSVRSASPGIAPAGAPPSKAPGAVVRVPNGARGGILGAPSATQGLDPKLASRLKALWRVGADAKHRGDNAGARKAWQDALRLRPGHPGFQEALDKLPR